MKQQDLIPHLFRTEFRKIVAVLSKFLGIEYIETAEDIASDTFLLAAETWPYQGLPPNPTAWLYTVAKNKAKNHTIRKQIFNEKIELQLSYQATLIHTAEIDLSDKNINDSQLQMLFAVCHPLIPVEAQIGLALRVLCGFGIDEIANAFLTNKETINKRLFRAKEKLRTEKIAIELPPEKEIPKRLEAVLRTLYLLFNEGYYSETQDTVLRNDFCLEAMRLTYLLTENDSTSKPEVKALLSLMCFHASRFEARKNINGEIILYHDQNENLWNKELIERGAYFLHQASQGSQISRYHLEASIAYWHTLKADTQEKWDNILQLYNQLLILEYSPIAALNRTFALAKVYGKATAIIEAEKLALHDNQYYFTLLGELYREISPPQAIAHFQMAYQLARTKADKHLIKQQLESLLAT
ncbi:RNA polymerase sigma factor [Emticicia sp. 17c]|uniref:RNA polymerase sigma factor n=1 Tax=Emticicia sp. 17c TaxID=3127704 RepID=UPI00301C5707